MSCNFCTSSELNFPAWTRRAQSARSTRLSSAKQHRYKPWPSLSPVLIPIKHLWDQPRPTSAVDLGAFILRVWDRIPMAFINHLILSMYRRDVAVINNNGCHTWDWPSFLNSSKYVMNCWQKNPKTFLETYNA